MDETTDLDRMLGVENKQYADDYAQDLQHEGEFPPAGYGVLYEKIILSADGKSYSSSIKLDLFDQAGKQTTFNDEATAEAKRMEFDSK